MNSSYSTICRTANKIAVQMEYLLGTSDSQRAGEIASTSIVATQEVLDSLVPTELRSWCELMESVFEKHRRDLADDPDKWQAFVGRQCDAFSNAGLHQKTILVLGNVFSDWNRQPVSTSEFTSSLDCLENLVSQQEDAMKQVLVDNTAPENVNNASIFALMHNALAVVLAGIVGAGNKPESDKVEESHVTMFGMTLFNQCVDSINQQVCDRAAE